MTKHEADVIGGLNMTDQISNEAYKQIMIATQDENEVADVLDKIRAEIEMLNPVDYGSIFSYESHTGAKDMKSDVLEIIDKHMERE